MINSFNHAIGRNMITLGGRCQANWELKLAELGVEARRFSNFSPYEENCCWCYQKMQHCIFVDSVISEKNSADTVHYISCYIKGYTNVFNYASFLSKISPRKLPFEQIHVSIFVIYLPFLIWE